MKFQQLRKLLLEIIHRIPTNESLKPYVKPILAVMFKLLEVGYVLVHINKIFKVNNIKVSILSHLT